MGRSCLGRHVWCLVAAIEEAGALVGKRGCVLTVVRRCCCCSVLSGFLETGVDILGFQRFEALFPSGVQGRPSNSGVIFGSLTHAKGDNASAEAADVLS